MAELVAGFLLPHDPLIAARPDAPPATKRANVRAAFRHIADRMRTLRVDTVVTIGDDHYGMFSPSCIPQCLIAIGDVEGPIEPWLGIERAAIPNHAELATHILHAGLADGIGWSFAKWIAVDHSTVLPYVYCYSTVPDVRTIPVYLNDGVPPLIPNAQAMRVGESIARAITSWPGAERVAICGTGGCSHWVGSPQMGDVNEDFDRKLLALLETGDIDAVIALADDDVTREAGNGAMELKNWLCAIGAISAISAMKATRTRLIAYEAIPEWISGIPFAELIAA
jgi:protocatechuate 4,5-dioxygenase beta chain